MNDVIGVSLPQKVNDVIRVSPLRERAECNRNRASFGLLYLLYGDCMKKSFYYVEEDYIQFLKKTEIEKRGFTTVPNMTYHNHDKFVYGIVMTINDVEYYVPFSHYDKQQEDNILIKVDYHKKIKVAGSLRFNYMFPVPRRCLIPVDFSEFEEKRKVLLRKEYKSCLSLLSQIQRRAKKTYNRVIEGKDEELAKNSCLFSILEDACRDYDSTHF